MNSSFGGRLAGSHKGWAVQKMYKAVCQRTAVGWISSCLLKQSSQRRQSIVIQHSIFGILKRLHKVFRGFRLHFFFSLNDHTGVHTQHTKEFFVFGLEGLDRSFEFVGEFTFALTTALGVLAIAFSASRIRKRRMLEYVKSCLTKEKNKDIKEHTFEHLRVHPCPVSSHHCSREEWRERIHPRTPFVSCETSWPAWR